MGGVQGQIDGQDLGQWGASRYLPGTDRWTGPGTVGGVQGQIDGQDLGQWGASRDR